MLPYWDIAIEVSVIWIVLRMRILRPAQELMPHPATIMIKRCEDVEVLISARAIKGALFYFLC